MQTDNLELLHNYLSCGHVIPDAADVSGNTLLHYAVAMGKYEIVKIVCKRLECVYQYQGWILYCTNGHVTKKILYQVGNLSHSFITSIPPATVTEAAG